MARGDHERRRTRYGGRIRRRSGRAHGPSAPAHTSTVALQKDRRGRKGMEEGNPSRLEGRRRGREVRSTRRKRSEGGVSGSALPRLLFIACATYRVCHRAGKGQALWKCAPGAVGPTSEGIWRPPLDRRIMPGSRRFWKREVPLATRQRLPSPGIV